MPTVEAVQDMVTGLHMVTTLLEYHIMVDPKHQVTNKVITLINISHTALGVLVVMEHNSVVEVLEDVRV